jgi:hypothetical protein
MLADRSQGGRKKFRFKNKLMSLWAATSSRHFSSSCPKIVW